MTDEVSTLICSYGQDSKYHRRRKEILSSRQDGGKGTLILFFKIDSFSHRQVDVKMFFLVSTPYIVIC